MPFTARQLGENAGLNSATSNSSAKWLESPAPNEVSELLELANFSGIEALLYRQLLTLRRTANWSKTVVNQLRTSAIHHAGWEITHQIEIARLLESLAEIGVTPLVLKGSALAYTHYPSPSLRTRCDTDLLINPASRETADRVLRELGYTKARGIEGEAVSYEAAYYRRDEMGFTHTFDLHWQVNNAQVFARLFRYDDLMSRARPITELDKRALGLCDIDALLLACLHRAAHLGYTTKIGDQEYREGNRLIWLYDMHLLFTGMPPEEQLAFANRALEIGLAGICLDALDTCREQLETPVPDEIREILLRAGNRESATRYLTAGRLQRGWIDFQSFPGWKMKWRFIRENFFPPAEYMRQRYPGADRRPLPFLYLQRAYAGIRKRISPAPRSLDR
jgi:hypothetical protein